MTVLDKDRHARLIADLDHVCEVANVPRLFIQSSMKEYCDKEEVDYVVNFRIRRDKLAGLVLSGKSNPDSRCMAIGGALIRNFIDARLMSLTQLLDAADTKSVPDPTVLIIPNLYMQTAAKVLPAWKISQLYDVLLQRLTANKPTVMSVESMQGLESQYGSLFAQHLQQHYTISEA